jgi:hypothetical protein
MPCWRANFTGLIVCGLCISAAAGDDFKTQHEHAVSDNPTGVHFTIAIRDAQKRFRVGERITLDYTFTADASGKYLAGATKKDQSGRSTYEKFVVDRPDDAADPVDGFFDLYSALYCSTIQFQHPARTTLTPSSPATDSVSLTQYLRFRKPGHYRVYATTRQVTSIDFRPARVQRKGLRPSVDDSSLFFLEYDYGGPLLASDNIVEFEVLPQDMKVAREEVEAIIARSKASADHALAAADAVRLFEIGTPQARQAAAQLYPSNIQYFTTSAGPYEAVVAVLAAPAHSEAIKLLQQRWLNPAILPDHELLFALPVLQLLEKNPGLTADDIRNGGRVSGDRWRNLLMTDIVAEYQSLMATLDQRASATDRAVALRFLHLNLTASKACSIPIPLPAEDTKKLKLMHLASLLDLPERELSADVSDLHWAEGIPQEEILPLLEKAFNNLPTSFDSVRVNILRTIARYDLQRAGELFRRRVIDHGWTPNIYNFFQDSSYDDFGGPDLDAYFGKVFATAHTDEMGRNGPLLARFGTAAILPQIKQSYEVEDASWPCSVQSGMLAYFLRVAPAYGASQTRTALGKSYADSQMYCWEHSLLASIANLYPAPALETLVNEALDDPRPLVAAGAAKTFDLLEPRALPYERLAGRLHKLHDEWPDYASHASDSAYTARWKSGYDHLEDMLSQMLTNTAMPRAALQWKAVLDDCVTDQCRARVSGRIRETAPARLQSAH